MNDRLSIGANAIAIPYHNPCTTRLFPLIVAKDGIDYIFKKQTKKGTIKVKTDLDSPSLNAYWNCQARPFMMLRRNHSIAVSVHPS